MDLINQYLKVCSEVIESTDRKELLKMVDVLASVRDRGGRLFILGVGGGAGHAGHAVNDFRKIGGFEAYAPTDNVSELTARTNDEGWTTVFPAWLETSRLGPKDGLLVFSVGGGNLEFGLSVNIAAAVELAKSRGAAICGIVGRDGGVTAKHADACIKVVVSDKALTTAITESFQCVFWHLLISHPKLVRNGMRWETAEKAKAGA